MFAAFHIADLPIVAALQEEPEWGGLPCGILCEKDARDEGEIPLLALNPAARGTRIDTGWPLARALVRCPDLKLLSRHPPTEAALLAELVALGDSFTPDVEITTPDTVLLDLSRTPSRRLGGLTFRGLEILHALAETPDLAHFAVLGADTRGRFISTAEMGNLPLSLLAKLNGGQTFLPLLDLLGVRTLGDFRRLPRQDLAERFGPLAGHWHDLVSGKSCRLLKLHRPPESLLQSVDFDHPVASSEALVFMFNRLLHGLCGRLEARHVAAATLEIRLRLEVGEMRRVIHLPEPLADPAALLKPIQTLAESLVLPAPVIGLELDATTAFPLSRQNDWIDRQLPHPERWADTLARLEGLLGSGRVGIPVPLQGQRPDAFEMRAPSAGTALAADRTPPASPLPLRRFRPPLEIVVASEISGSWPRPLALLTGPHCGPVLEQRGPFFRCGQPWDPASLWQRLEWDIRVKHAPLLRLVLQPGDRWQLDGSYF